MSDPALPPIESVIEAIRASWDADTSDDPAWTPENPALGQCAVSSLVLRALYGGDIVIATVLDRDGERTPDGHAWNVLPDGTHVDCSFDQFTDGEQLGEPIVCMPVIEGDHTRPQILADRVGARIGREIVVPPDYDVY